jgi:hypothetical protein
LVEAGRARARCLKRHLVRELFPLLKADLQQANSTR